MTVGAILAVILAAGILAGLSIRKIRRGGACCGEHEGPDRKISAGDRNPKHYPYRYLLEVDGMVCGNCVRNVENAFHRRGGFFAKADLGKRSVRVLAKEILTERVAAEILSGASYTLLTFTEEENHEAK